MTTIIDGTLGILVNSFGVLGSTSGQTVLQPQAVASGTLTLPAATDTVVARNTTDTLTNKTLTSPVIGSGVTFNGSSSGTTLLQSTAISSGTLTLPAATDTLVGKATTDTLTNKTLTSPVIGTGATFNGTSTGTTLVQASATASGTLTLPAATDTLVGKATTDTLTNKTLTAPSITTMTYAGVALANSVTGSSGSSMVLSTAPTITGQVLAAGTNTVAPLTFTSGTNLSTAAAGAVEYDGTVLYATNNASNRGVSHAFQYCMMNGATYTLTSQTAAQKLFNTSTNGAITLPAGFFRFECMYTLSSMSTSSGSFGFALGGTATFTQLWWASALKNAAGAAGAADGNSWNTAANTTLVTATVTATGMAMINGVIRVTVGGTIIPQVSLGVAAAAVVGANSYFQIAQIANTTTTTVGNWS